MINAFVCNCKNGFTGTICGTEINECASNPCLNGGTCVRGLGQYTCNCPTGVNGTNCQTEATLYTCNVTTPNVATGDTVGSAYFTFNGTNGTTSSLLVGTGFSLGSTQPVSVRSWINVVSLKTLTVLLSPSSDAWYLGTIVCDVGSAPPLVTFTYNSWLNKVTPSVALVGTASE